MAAMVCTVMVSIFTQATEACTRVLWNNNDLAVVVGRSMDWPESTQPMLAVFPRGLSHDGGLVGNTTVDAEHPARWTSQYGSLVTTIYGVGTADGVNEKGLAIHMLYLTATDFGPRDPAKAGVQAGLWGQILLDQAATVAEALELMKQIQPLNVEVAGHQANVHLAIEDATGDSAIIEYIDGKPVVHHGPDVRILTNDPVYEEQLANLARYDFSNATRQTPLPGNVDPRDRFVRAAYYLQMLPEPKTERQAVADVLAIARNVSVPFGAPNNLPGSLYNTEYRTVIDLTHPCYYFELSTAPNLIWVPLAQLDFTDGAPVKMLDPDDIQLSGDVSRRFKTVEKAPF